MKLPAFTARGTRLAANASDIESTESQIGQPLPDDYRSFLLQTDGFEGFIDENVYLALWSVSEIPALNEAYATSRFLPGVILIGTDGGDTGYGFTRAEGKARYVSVPLVGMNADAVLVLGESLRDAMERSKVGSFLPE